MKLSVTKYFAPTPALSVIASPCERSRLLEMPSPKNESSYRKGSLVCAPGSFYNRGSGCLRERSCRLLVRMPWVPSAPRRPGTIRCCRLVRLLVSPWRPRRFAQCFRELGSGRVRRTNGPVASTLRGLDAPRHALAPKRVFGSLGHVLNTVFDEGH